MSCAERNGLKLICVTLSDPNDWDDHKALYDWAFENYEYKSVLPLGAFSELPVISGERDTVGITAPEDTRILVKKNAKIDFSLELPRFVYAGVKAGDCAGRVFIKADGVQVGEFPLLYSESVSVADNEKLSAWGRFKRAWFMANKYGFLFQGSD